MQVGRLWTSLADYYIRRGLIEKARDVYEEGLTTVTTVRDFSLIFDTLTQVYCLSAAFALTQALSLWVLSAAPDQKVLCLDSLDCHKHVCELGCGCHACSSALLP